MYHVTVVSTWNWNATVEEKKARYDVASNSIDNLRAITPDAAYLVSVLSVASLSGHSSLCDSRTKRMFTSPTTKVRTDGFSTSLSKINMCALAVAFWGTHYTRLLEIKKK